LLHPACLASEELLKKLSSASFIFSFVPPSIRLGRVRKDQEATPVHIYLRQKRQVAEAEATRNVFTEKDYALNAPIQ
jgi:hypothetical protein